MTREGIRDTIQPTGPAQKKRTGITKMEELKKLLETLPAESLRAVADYAEMLMRDQAAIAGQPENGQNPKAGGGDPG